MNKYYYKYLKYKNKYLTLKKILGGTIDNIAIYGSAFKDNYFGILKDIANKHKKVYIGLYYNQKTQEEYNNKFQSIQNYIKETNISNITIIQTEHDLNPVTNGVAKFLQNYYKNEKIDLTVYYKPRNIKYNSILRTEIINLLEKYNDIKLELKSIETLEFVTIGEIQKKFQNIKITDETKKQINVLAYSGCFCPPHREHFNNIINNIDKYELAYLGIYNPYGETKASRHGTPPIFAFEQFNKWIKSKNLQDKVNIILCEIKENPLECIQDKLIDLAKNNPNNNYSVIQIVGDEPSYSVEVINRLKKRFNISAKTENISYDIIKVPRNTENNISATKFIECLNDYKKNNKIDCKHYLPEHLSNEEKNEYINTISTYDIY